MKNKIYYVYFNTHEPHNDKCYVNSDANLSYNPYLISKEEAEQLKKGFYDGCAQCVKDNIDNGVYSVDIVEWKED